MGNSTCCASSAHQSSSVKDDGLSLMQRCCEPNEIIGVAAASNPSRQEPVSLSASSKELSVGNVPVLQEVAPYATGHQLSTTEGDKAAGGKPLAVPKNDVRQQYDDGSTYYGQVIDGRRHGRGSWRSKSMQYEGQWLADVQHGEGVQFWSDGGCYKGQFSQGTFSGNGRMSWKGPAGGMHVYEGQYVEDLKHGIGRFQWADGRIYEGEWRAGKRHGRGAFTNAHGKVTTGVWIDDKFTKPPPSQQTSESQSDKAG